MLDKNTGVLSDLIHDDGVTMDGEGRSQEGGAGSRCNSSVHKSNPGERVGGWAKFETTASLNSPGGAGGIAFGFHTRLSGR
jgi:hypothetical protein